MPVLPSLLLLAAQGFGLEREVRAVQLLEASPLDVAFLDAERLLVLTADAMWLYRLQGETLSRLSSLALPGAPVKARAAAGLLRVVTQEGACWALSNRRAGATLFSVEGERLVAVVGAEAIPPTAFGLHGSPAGVRFLPGTNLLAVGDSAYLRFEGEGSGVRPDGTLVVDGEPDPAGRRAGDALAILDDGLVVTSGDGPPDAPDEVLLLRRGQAEAEASWPTPGRVRALAARPGDGAASLAVAFDTAAGAVLEIVDLRRSRR
ncbi:MAG TPA: hypothetical protein VFM88_14745 [Vicinamibacteria bacterium]|nr:hypothetical protein [Vicinamibacteria bacterium]